MSRAILVTGASSGIGRAIAVAFAEHGDRVAVSCTAEHERARATLAALPGQGHALIPGDLSDPSAAERIVAAATEAIGGVDVLVNNAAEAPSTANAHAIADTSYTEWQRVWRQMIDVNLLGAANVSYWAAQAMIERDVAGRIVNIGSRGVFRGEPEHPAYAASKAALHSLGQSLAISLAPHGISVTSVAPGFVHTDRTAPRLAGPDGDALRAQSPFGRVAEASEVASAVLYLASADATWASGAILDLNGAAHLRT